MGPALPKAPSLGPAPLSILPYERLHPAHTGTAHTLRQHNGTSELQRNATIPKNASKNGNAAVSTSWDLQTICNSSRAGSRAPKPSWQGYLSLGKLLSNLKWWPCWSNFSAHGLRKPTVTKDAQVMLPLPPTSAQQNQSRAGQQHHTQTSTRGQNHLQLRVRQKTQPTHLSQTKVKKGTCAARSGNRRALISPSGKRLQRQPKC